MEWQRQGHPWLQPRSSRFNYRRFPRYSSSRGSACSLLAALLELLLSGNATAALSPSPRDEQHLTLSLTLVPGWHRGRSHRRLSLPTSGGGYERPFPSQLSSCLFSSSAGTPRALGSSAVTAQ